MEEGSIYSYIFLPKRYIFVQEINERQKLDYYLDIINSRPIYF